MLLEAAINDSDMALSGMLLLPIPTFANGASVKDKPMGTGTVVNSVRMSRRHLSYSLH